MRRSNLLLATRRQALQAGVAGVLALALTGGSLPAAAVAPRYYIRLRTVELADAAPGPAAAQQAAPPATGDAPAPVAPTAKEASAISLAHDMLVEALRKRPEVVLELDGVPADAPAARYIEELKRRNLKGYEVTLRILKLERGIKPPPPGRKFRLLEQNVKLSLVGTVFPGDPQLALGGDGESTVQIEVGTQVSESQERDVMTGALQDAVEQAVSQALRKLTIGPMKPPKDPPRRRK